MVNYFLVFTLIFFYQHNFSLLAQNSSELRTKQRELNTLKTEIAALEKEIQEKIKKEKESFDILQKFDKQSYLLNKMINQYRTEQKQKEEQILAAEKRIYSLEYEINKLQVNYSKYVKAVYKKKQTSTFDLLFDSESVSQAIKRIFYLKKFSDWREKDLRKLEKSKQELLLARQQLEIEKAEKDFTVKEKLEEENTLKQKMLMRKQLLASLRKDKTELKNELAAKKKAEISIKNLISKLNEEKLKFERELKEKSKLVRDKSEIVKKESDLTKTRSDKKISYEKKSKTSTVDSFEKFKGNLNWPVNNGKIIRRYGENINPALRTVTLNYGVDIKVTSDMRVYSVASGLISAIEWIPGYGSIIIITHSDDYRTVYSHLSEIYVDEGDFVNSGDVIAKVAESLTGNILHFEIWNSRENQNPEIWLAKK